ncbi:HTH cro/C1-type domain-containing protein [Mycobacterium phage RitSun]|uniref:Immunity repressor n=1 Tax=Mycobacterium phage Demsculpinboyz TaxID=2041528 RepID=A0A2D1GA16_9CAUD|nr:hypothetical protein I5I02_gp054 [Mycobacterium phage Demsculpinboyz]ATN88649.1 hypothetical protein SEA_DEMSCULPINBOYZ_54 [Mycobacterium phage Demsculpinboyz]QXG07428.1 HTH cro/C1-type domain-containing protein [Mycobacterium phage RitSun]
MATNHQLALLIDGIKAANGWSDPDLVRNAKEKGYVLSKSNISRYRNPVVSIKGEVILALAAGLRVTPAQVAVAALQSMGIQLPQYDMPTPEQAVELDTELSARDKAALLALIGQFRRTPTPAGAPHEAEGQEVSNGSERRTFAPLGSGKRARKGAGEHRA